MEDDVGALIKRLNQKEEQYKESLKVSEQYNVREDINRYELLLSFIDYLKTGKKHQKI